MEELYDKIDEFLTIDYKFSLSSYFDCEVYWYDYNKNNLIYSITLWFDFDSIYVDFRYSNERYDCDIYSFDDFIKFFNDYIKDLVSN